MNPPASRARRLGARSLTMFALAASLCALGPPATALGSRVPALAAQPPIHGPVFAAVGASSLESAANRATSTGRRVAMSLVALGFAIAAIVLLFKRDFKEAAGVIVVGMIAILLITPAGVNLLRDTVGSLVGGR